jgi:hypothetical protein
VENCARELDTVVSLCSSRESILLLLHRVIVVPGTLTDIASKMAVSVYLLVC